VPGSNCVSSQATPLLHSRRDFLKRCGIALSAPALTSLLLSCRTDVYQGARLSSVSSRPTTPGTAYSAEQRIVQNIAQGLEHLRVPGASVAVINNYRVEWAHGFGVLETGSNGVVTEETLFQAASISKPVTAMAVLKLVQDRKLTLSEDVNGKLQSWKVPENEFSTGRPITLSHLLSHIAGLTVPGFPGYAQDQSLPTLLQVLDGKPPANTPPIRVQQPPGKQWRYSGGGYCVAQQLLTDVSAIRFTDLMKKTVLEPLGMQLSTFEQPLLNKRQLMAASAHRNGDQKVPGNCYVYPEQAAAGLWTTPSDLARFCNEIQRAYSGQPSALISPQLAREMVTSQIQTDFGGMGLGLALNSHTKPTVFEHSGTNQGFRCRMIATLDGKGAVLMTNSDAADQRELSRLIRVIAVEYGWA
jgi:CubicO group peptidase (beta-lactamase class C family)